MPMISLPGPAEIDECHIGAKIRGTHGRQPAPGKIVFGIKCRTTGLALLFPVNNRSKSTLLPILSFLWYNIDFHWSKTLKLCQI